MMAAAQRAVRLLRLLLGPRPFSGLAPLRWMHRARVLRLAWRDFKAQPFCRSDDPAWAAWCEMDARRGAVAPTAVLGAWMSPPRPRVAFVVSCEQADRAALRRTIEAILVQSAPDWVLLLRGGRSIPFALRVLSWADRRIRIAGKPDDWTCAECYQFLTPGYVPAAWCVRRVCDAFDAAPGARLAVADEDEYDVSTVLGRPLLKPGWSPDLLARRDYLGAAAWFRRDLPVGAPREELLAACEGLADSETLRIPEPLVHRPTGTPRETPRISTAREPVAWPRVSVAMLCPGKRRHLKRALSILREKTDYPDLEILAAETSLRADPQPLDGVRSIRLPGASPAEALNVVAREAQGELLLFFDRRVWDVDPSWLRELVRGTMRPGMGAAAPLLFSSAGKVFASGMMLGVKTVMASAIEDAPLDEPCVLAGALSTRNVSALRPEIVLVNASAFRERGGFDAALHQHHVLDFCARTLAAGRRLAVIAESRVRMRSCADVFGHGDFFRLMNESWFRDHGEDLGFHPRLDAWSAAPRLRMPDAPSTGANLAGQLRALDEARTPFAPIDWMSDASVAAALDGTGQALAAPNATDADAARDVVGATRYILTRLRADAAPRARFPKALSEGADGAFCSWLTGDEEKAAEGLSDDAARHIREAFASHPGYSVRYRLRWSSDLRLFFPLALLPTGQALFLRWLVMFGRAQGYTDVAIWWFFIEASEDPAREFVFTYRLHAEWQRLHPAGLTRFGRDALVEWVERTYGFSPGALRDLLPEESPRAFDELHAHYANTLALQERFPDAMRRQAQFDSLVHEELESGRIDAAWVSRLHNDIRQGFLTKPGVNILGHLCRPCGLQQAALAVGRSMQEAGVRVSWRDLPAIEAPEPPVPPERLGAEIHETSIVCVAPFAGMEDCYARGTLSPRPDVYRIGHWYWEFHDIPAIWKVNGEDYDEIWAPTRFIAQAFEGCLDIPVHLMPPPFVVEPVSMPRADLGLPEDEFLFLFVFDMGSCIDRKNPLGVIRAFKKAFSPDERVRLIVKTSQGEQHPEDYAKIVAACEGASITPINRLWPRRSTLALIHACDAYVSLHRSEGLGLTIAEAMLLGKPAIATAYSGNLDFMTEENSRLIPYDMTRMERKWGPYEEGWAYAEPRIEDAAAAMRWVFERREDAAFMAMRGCADAAAFFCPVEAGRRFRDRLEAILSEQGHGW